jgi:hypothetical protein
MSSTTPKTQLVRGTAVDQWGRATYIYAILERVTPSSRFPAHLKYRPKPGTLIYRKINKDFSPSLFFYPYPEQWTWEFYNRGELNKPLRRSNRNS